MKLFLDTEFTDLIPGNRLISIALVDEHGEYFYAEMSDTYTKNHCSDFVIDNVIPHLLGGNYKMTFDECALRISKWIENKQVRCILAMDNMSWDLPHLSDLLQPVWPSNLEKTIYHHVYVPDDDFTRLCKEHKYTAHNALHDAFVMYHVYKESQLNNLNKR